MVVVIVILMITIVTIIMIMIMIIILNKQRNEACRKLPGGPAPEQMAEARLEHVMIHNVTLCYVILHYLRYNTTLCNVV